MWSQKLFYCLKALKYTSLWIYSIKIRSSMTILSRKLSACLSDFVNVPSVVQIILDIVAEDLLVVINISFSCVKLIGSFALLMLEMAPLKIWSNHFLTM